MGNKLYVVLSIHTALPCSKYYSAISSTELLRLIISQSTVLTHNTETQTTDRLTDCHPADCWWLPSKSGTFLFAWYYRGTDQSPSTSSLTVVLCSLKGCLHPAKPVWLSIRAVSVVGKFSFRCTCPRWIINSCAQKTRSSTRMSWVSLDMTAKL